MLIKVIGVLAILTSSSRLIPQIIKSYMTKKVRDVSLLWEFLGMLSSFFWIWYAYLNSDKVLFIGAGILLVGYIILGFQKKIYK